MGKNERNYVFFGLFTLAFVTSIFALPGAMLDVYASGVTEITTRVNSTLVEILAGMRTVVLSLGTLLLVFAAIAMAISKDEQNIRTGKRWIFIILIAMVVAGAAPLIAGWAMDFIGAE